MNAEFYKSKKMALLFYAKSITLCVFFTDYYTPPKPHFELGSGYLACHMII